MTRATLKRRIEELKPWYHTMRVAPFLWTRPWTRETLGQWWNCERGAPKFNRFLLPYLPVPLKGTSVLDLGTNCGALLWWALKRGAVSGVGIEADRRYWEQARFLREVYGGNVEFLLGDALHVLQMNGAWEDQPFTYAFLNAFIYHVRCYDRVTLLSLVGEYADYVLIQGNGLEPNQPDGRGFWSMAHLALNAGLEIVEWGCQPHCRGAVIVARKP